MTNEYTYHAYYEAIRTYAQEVLDLAGNNENAQATVIDNIVDASAWVFQFFAARQVIEYSENDAAYEIQEIELKGNYLDITCMVAREALRQDIIDAILLLREDQDRD